MSDDGLRTLLVGIDAACERTLDPLFAAGELPTLEGLLKTGASGPLESQIPPWTASAWPSLYTGTNPGKHGVFSFLSFDGYDWDVVNATDVRERTIWEYCDREGLSSVVVNVPVTHPSRPFDGALIPGYTAPEDPDCHPEGLLEEVRAAIGEYRVYPVDDSTNAYRDCVRSRGEAFRYLTDRVDPDFGFLQFQATDTIFHKRPEDDEAIRAIYREVDRQVERVLTDCEPTTVVVASDHGIGPYEGSEFRINDFLHETGYVETVRGGPGVPTFSRALDRSLAAGEYRAGGDRSDGARSAGKRSGGDRSAGNRAGGDRSGLERAVEGMAKVGLTSQRIERLLDRIGLAEFVAERVPDAVVSAGTTQVDFPASKAYVRSRIELGVRINLAGREPDGVVPQSAYDETRRELIEHLRAVRTPDGEPVFETVVPREAIFHGPESHRAVDIVTVPADYDHYLSATIRGERFGEPTEPWNHKRDGIVAIAGGDVDRRVGVGDAHLCDVAPTVLATLGIPAAERMDGRVLACVSAAGTRSYPRLDDDRSVETADERVERRLADLGYLE